MMRSLRSRPLFLIPMLALVSACVFAMVRPVHAHPGHTTTAEAEWKPKTGTLEVALRLPIRQLELILSSGKEARMRFGHSVGFEKAARAYVRSRFYAYRGEPEVKPDWKWLGMEASKEDGGRTVWCYFEIALGRDQKQEAVPWKWKNRLFVELAKDQTNAIRLRSGDQLVARDFNIRTVTHSIFEKAPPSVARKKLR